jgi:hypothetical protein
VLPVRLFCIHILLAYKPRLNREKPTLSGKAGASQQQQLSGSQGGGGVGQSRANAQQPGSDDNTNPGMPSMLEIPSKLVATPLKVQITCGIREVNLAGRIDAKGTTFMGIYCYDVQQCVFNFACLLCYVRYQNHRNQGEPRSSRDPPRVLGAEQPTGEANTGGADVQRRVLQSWRVHQDVCPT